MTSKTRRTVLFAFATIVISILLGATEALAQTTAFTYQGRLTDGGTVANGNYDLQFVLWDSLSAGVQVGSTQTLNTVAVSNGVFTVSLDFGANAFAGASRFLEIGARPSGAGSFTLLTPRQPITSTPYAVRSLTATSADTVTVNGNQAFAISGVGGFSNSNTFAGIGAGAVTTPEANGNGSFNSFFGNDAGRNNTTGGSNSFFGRAAGRSNTTGGENSFFGFIAGTSNTTGASNSFFGRAAGISNTTGGSNSFFGQDAGFSNTTGGSNSFFGNQVGQNNTTGILNSHFGFQAGSSATGDLNTFVGAFTDVTGPSRSGNRNTLLGANAKLLTGILFSPINATAIGANAQVDASNSLVLGSIKNVNGATADTNVGIGTTAPTAKLSVIARGDGARVLHLGTERAWVFKQFGTGAATALELTGDDANNNNKNFAINTAGNVGIGTQGPLDKLHVIGDIRVGVFGTNGCLKNNNGGTIVGTCSSDSRFKRDVSPFPNLLNKVTQLRPVHYFWRATEFPEKGFGNAQSYGLVAQEVERVLPELVSHDAEGLKQIDYSKLPLMLLQAVKEQQAQIQEQQQQIDALKKLVCQSNPQVDICKGRK